MLLVRNPSIGCGRAQGCQLHETKPDPPTCNTQRHLRVMSFASHLPSIGTNYLHTRPLTWVVHDRAATYEPGNAATRGATIGHDSFATESSDLTNAARKRHDMARSALQLLTCFERSRAHGVKNSLKGAVHRELRQVRAMSVRQWRV